MTISIVVLDQEEKFLQFLDPDLCELEETIEAGGLRTITLDYKFQDLNKDKELFRIGNKVWIQGDDNLSDCLYVINTSVKEDVYKENSISLELEEVLVELNYAPVFSQTEITSSNGFTISNTNGEQEVLVNWNALNYFFGKYFNIGVVQDCLSDYAQKISITGTVNRMSLLRSIEEETGNVFVTRYEKDVIDNTIHRYLDFLNPINVSKDWEFNLEYQFVSTDTTTYIYDSNDNLTTDTYDDVKEEDDVIETREEEAPTNINPANVSFRIVDYYSQLIDEDLEWSATDLGLTNTNQIAAISLSREGDKLAVDVGSISYATGSEQNNDVESPGNGIISISRDPENQVSFILPDDSYFEFYDTVSKRVLFRTRINHMIGMVHEEILDFGYNLDNITYEVDETETYHAISPILTSDGDNGLTRTQMDNLIEDWLNLEVTKGDDVIPMIVQKVNVKSELGTLDGATSTLGTYDLSTNYFVRPYNPNDNTSGTNDADKTFEFFKAVAYWKAPFTKHAGEMHIETDTASTIQYKDVLSRPDGRNERGLQYHPKIGNVETSDENIYSIYNDVCMKLKDKQYPDVKIEVDIANLLGMEFNNYDIHDKVYIKIPDSQELLTARVTKTKKEAHDIAKNTIEITNYTVNTVKTIQHETLITAENMSFPYPTVETLTVRLENAEYDDTDEYSVHYLTNKLVNISIFKDNEFRKAYTKRTNLYGCCTLPLTLKPGDYDIQITFGGDEEYLDTSLTIQVNVYGTTEVEENAVRDTQSKVTSSTTKTKTVTTYYDKYGRSPDKKTILAIGRISASGDSGSYANFYATEFKNYCPHCGKSELYWSIYWAGNETSNWGTFPATGRKEGGSAEGHIFCKHCDADYSCQGHEHVSGGKSLKVTKSTKKSSKADAYTLKKGKYKYGTKTETVKSKSTDSQTRTNISSGMNGTIQKKALSIVGNSTGIAAAKKIAEWCRNNIKYAYYTGFNRKPTSVLSKGSGNCCDQSRLMLTMMDAVGCRSTLTLKYVKVCCNTSTHPGVGHIFTCIINTSTGKKTYVDPCKTSGSTCWGKYVTGWGSPPGTQYNYSYGSTPF